ncbi:peptidoglycan-binding domain-containing protein [Nostoc sp. CMAA1605]|uniref:peptidoglycan-binding domain-containing protein n=1 Tax=Nostoc sp. CMAA1605 TaxID=2055159 RepID=UPI001F2C3427|nr:peptidoglycan-binding domain-containing protein [Nostoc sp. CMAA1605]MCF4965778.1 peptidoglycan-binding protein [Nostoc sp. CMAA1605]
MKGSLTASIVSYLNLLKTFRCCSTSRFYWLLLFSCSSVFLGLSAVVAVTTPQQIAQQVGISRPTLKVGSQGERVSELQAALKLLGFYSGAVDGNYNEATANAVSQFKQTVGLSPDGIVDAATWQKLFPNQPLTASTATNNSPSNFPVPTQPATVINNRPEPRPANPRAVPNQVVGTKPTPNRTPTKPPNNQVVRTTPVSRTTNSRQNPSNTTRLSPTPPANRIAGVQYTTEGWPILRVGMSNPEVSKLQTRLSQLGFLKGSVDGYFGVMTETAVKAAQKRYGINPDGVVGGATWEALLQRSSQRR